MKIVQLYGLHDLRVREEALPIPNKGQTLLKITSVGICGSDLHWFKELKLL